MHDLSGAGGLRHGTFSALFIGTAAAYPPDIPAGRTYLAAQGAGAGAERKYRAPEFCPTAGGMGDAPGGSAGRGICAGGRGAGVRRIQHVGSGVRPGDGREPGAYDAADAAVDAGSVGRDASACVGGGHAHERRAGGGDVSHGDRALASGGVAGRDHSGGQRPADRFPASIRVGDGEPADDRLADAPRASQDAAAQSHRSNGGGSAADQAERHGQGAGDAASCAHGSLCGGHQLYGHGHSIL